MHKKLLTVIVATLAWAGAASASPLLFTPELFPDIRVFDLRLSYNASTNQLTGQGIAWLYSVDRNNDNVPEDHNLGAFWSTPQLTAWGFDDTTPQYLYGSARFSFSASVDSVTGDIQTGLTGTARGTMQVEGNYGSLGTPPPDVILLEGVLEQFGFSYSYNPSSGTGTGQLQMVYGITGGLFAPEYNPGGGEAYIRVSDLAVGEDVGAATGYFAGNFENDWSITPDTSSYLAVADIQAIPEPGTYVLVLTGAAFLAWRRFRVGASANRG